ncbi:YdcF family protein [Virgibacillus halophilus]|uniref:YdcF family protein n=1 Tax=Tigheibacillus halophilus TaxID=361280 RepID=A0ABU5CAN8_9BACI|nr:YdcF family protein [Virgibacillus halophilus]
MGPSCPKACCIELQPHFVICRKIQPPKQSHREEWVRGEDVTEAQAIASYLVNHGIDEERILLEKESTSTSENLLFSKQLYPIKEAVIVSNDFHLFRATSEADKIGIKAYPLAAKTPTAVKWKLYIREYAAILKMTITGK